MTGLLYWDDRLNIPIVSHNYVEFFCHNRNLRSQWKREVWRHKTWFNPQFRMKCLYQVRTIAIDHFSGMTTLFLSFSLDIEIDLSSSVVLLLPLFTQLYCISIVTLHISSVMKRFALICSCWINDIHINIYLLKKIIF